MKTIEEVYNGMKPGTKIKSAFIIVTILFALIVLLFAIGYNANNHRVTDLQKSRISSCQATYLAFIKVFSPFLPSDGEQESLPKEQQNRLHAFYDKINELIAGCANQVNLNKSQLPEPTDTLGKTGDDS